MLVTAYNTTPGPIVVDGETGRTLAGMSWGTVNPDDPVVKTAAGNGFLHLYMTPLDTGPGQDPAAVAAAEATAAANQPAAGAPTPPTSPAPTSSAPASGGQTGGS